MSPILTVSGGRCGGGRSDGGNGGAAGQGVNAMGVLLWCRLVLLLADRLGGLESEEA